MEWLLPFLTGRSRKPGRFERDPVKPRKVEWVCMRSHLLENETIGGAFASIVAARGNMC